MPPVKSNDTEMLRYFRDRTSGFDEELFRRALERVEREGLKADEMESSLQSFSEEERRRRFGAVIRADLSALRSPPHGTLVIDDLREDEFRFILLKEIAERRMVLIAERSGRHADIARPQGSWRQSGGGFLSLCFAGDGLSINVLNRSWSSAILSDTTENYGCIRACLENLARTDQLLASLDVRINITIRERMQRLHLT